MNFASDVEEYANSIGEDVNQVLRSITLDLCANVINETPVDEGTARNNWFSAVNRRPKGTRKADKEGSKAMAQLESEVEKFKMGDKFTMVNRTPYILALEYGHSDQARSPDGMLRKSVAKAEQFVKQGIQDANR